MRSSYELVNRILDTWSNFDFKTLFGRPGVSTLTPASPPQWIDEEDLRRLRAYSLLEAYCRNKGRTWSEKAISSVQADRDSVKDRREYGDAKLLVETALSSLVGDEWKVITEGAIDSPEEAADTSAVKQQELLQEWSDQELFGLKMIENETQAIKFGDGVYVLAWDDDLKRPKLHVYDPAFYFPKFDPRAKGAEDFPPRIEIAWEFEEENADDKPETFVRRLVWELQDEDDDGNAIPTNCAYYDEIWSLKQAVEGFKGTPLETLAQDWLGIDWIPVVHLPNTVNLQAHFGESVLADVMQIIDDIQSVDTDLQAAAATTGSPPIAISGQYGTSDQTGYGPGTLLYTGEGSAALLDTSRSLDALLKLKDALLERLAVNGRTPESLLGRVKPNEVPSGIALTLSFTPHAGMIKKMRLVRDHKYSLLFKFVVRMYREFGNVDGLPEDDVRSYLLFGSFLPSDRQETMTIVMNLYSAKTISLETAVQLLMEAGYPIEDYLLEIQRIEKRDYDAANQLMLITGNPELAAERLGIDPSEIVADLGDGEEEQDTGDV